MSLTNTTNRSRVYVTRQLPQKGLDLLLGRCNVSYWDSADPAPRTELLRNIPGIDVLVCMPTDKIDREILNAAGPSLKIVATMSEDADHIEMAECSRRQIKVLTLPEVTIETVTEMIFAMIRLTASKWMGSQTCNLNAILQSKEIIEAIKEDQNFCLELSNRTVGIVGLNAVGLAVGTALKDLGMSSILYNDVEPVSEEEDLGAEFVDFSDLLKRSDMICVCSDPFKDECTKVLFDKAAFKQMKNDAIFIDASKGRVVDYSDLYEALRTGAITAAGMDVREYDVIPNRHPLAVLDNCFFLPFRECYKWDGRKKCSADLVKSVLSGLQELEFAKKRSEKCSKPAMLEARTRVPIQP